MPQPIGPRTPNPDDLAKEIARRLAEAGTPEKPGSLRESVLVGRLISGTIVLAAAAAVVLGIFAGVDWVLDRAGAGQPQVLSGEVLAESGVASAEETTTTGTADLMWLLGTVASPPSLGPVSTQAPEFVVGVALPPPKTPAPAPARPGSPTTLVPTTTGPGLVTTSQPPTSSSVPGPAPSVPPSTSVPGPTIPSTTTTTSTVTTTTVTTTTTVPTSTTIGTTTTLPDETTTTCGNNGSGKGNC